MFDIQVKLISGSFHKPIFIHWIKISLVEINEKNDVISETCNPTKNNCFNGVWLYINVPVNSYLWAVGMVMMKANRSSMNVLKALIKIHSFKAQRKENL